jgi:hypothetical protein
MLLLLGIFVGLVVPQARPRLLVHARHLGAPWSGCVQASRAARIAGGLSCNRVVSLSLRDNTTWRNVDRVGASRVSAGGTRE